MVGAERPPYTRSAELVWAGFKPAHESVNMLGIIDNRFELLARLDRGDGETVYYGRDRNTQRPVLVRELIAKCFDDPESFEFFLAEFDQAARIAHRAVVEQFFLKRAADQRVFIISEYVPGTSLRVLLDRLVAAGEVWPPQIAVYIAAEVAGALQTAHSYVDPRMGDPFPVLHLDICPTTILLSHGGVVKLKGFELSRLRLRRSGVDRSDRLSFRSPERIQGAYLDRRSDLFSLGAVLYALLAGAPPFPGATTAEIRQRIIAGRCDFTALERPAIPPGLKPILERTLAPPPDNRYGDTSQFAGALSSLTPRMDPAGAARELVALIARVFEPNALCLPQEESVAAPETITTETLRVGPQAEAALPPPPTKKPARADRPADRGESVKPSPAVIPAGPEERTRKEVAAKSSGESKKLPRPKLLLGLAGLAIVAVILVFAVTRLVRLLHSNKPQNVEITSIPSGAQVYLDGRVFGQTPCTVPKWPEGVVSLRVEADGFIPTETTVVVDENHAPVFSVFVLSRMLAINSRPPGAEVWVNGTMVSGARAAGYPLRAIDTLTIEVRKPGLSSPPPLSLSALGSIGNADPRRWLIEDRTDQTQMVVTGVFARKIMIAARPPQASVYVDGDTTAVGIADQPVELSFGAHRVTLRHPSFLDYVFDFEVTEDSPERYTPTLSRYVRISAVGEDAGVEDIGADIRWIHQEDKVIKSGGDLRTPYSLKLEGLEHQIMLTRKGFRDTVVVLAGDVDTLTVTMTAEKKAMKAPPAAESMPEAFGLVQFFVKRSGKPVSGASVVGHDKDKDLDIKLGQTDGQGELLVKIPPGKYEFFAVEGGKQTRLEDEKIKPGKKTKSITLEFR